MGKQNVKKPAGSIDAADIQVFRQTYEGNPVKKATANAIARSGLAASAFRNNTLREIKHVFSIDIKTMPVTNQKASGRCWLFAGLNLLREDIARKLNLEEFELSQNYLAFWDKFEKINYFLEAVLDTLAEPAEGRLVSWLMSSLQDGGQWDMFVNLVEKYGVVPKQAMPETFHSESTGAMNQIVNTLLRKQAAELRRRHAAGQAIDELRQLNQALLAEMYGLLCQCFGEPPQQFDWEYTNKENQYTRHEDLTPQSFAARFLTMQLADYVSMINAPTDDKPFGKTFTVKFIGNVVGGRKILYLNTELADLKSLVVRQLQDGEIVWFGSDVSYAGDRDVGAWFNNLYDYQSLLGFDLAMDKADMLDYRHSSMNHAMVITGVNLQHDRPNRWKIENSWGGEKANKGYHAADDSWFDRFVYQAVVHKRYLSAEQLAALQESPIELEPWDPMGTLAD